MESSLVVGDQCLLLSWVTLAHEFTFPRMYIQAFVRYLLKLSWTFYQRSYVLTEPGNILLPTNENDSAVIYGGCLYINLHYMYCKLQNISIFHCIRNFNWVKWLKGSSLEHTWPDWILRGVFMIISFCWILFRGGKGRVSFTINVSLWILSKY